jgi:hypothetical protein
VHRYGSPRPLKHPGRRMLLSGIILGLDSMGAKVAT